MSSRLLVANVVDVTDNPKYHVSVIVSNNIIVLTLILSGMNFAVCISSALPTPPLSTCQRVFPGRLLNE
eukprot:5530146-Lingulodinium_polyedra.AAC.1